MRTLFLLLLATNLFGITAHARLTNADLRPQVQGDPLRKLPCKELYCLAVDGHLFYHMTDTSKGYHQGFYHGGYWVPIFAEVNPFETLSVNLKTVAYNPSHSYGVAATGYFHPFFSASWHDNLSHFDLWDLDVLLRFSDLDRQTLGAGLTLQDKEMAGWLLQLSKKDLRFRWIFDGTGGYNLVGDLHYFQLDYLDNLIGISEFTHELRGKGFYSIYSRHPLSGDWQYAAEVSTRLQAMAGLAALEYKKTFSALKVGAKAESRYYGNNYANGIKKQVAWDYVSIEQDDKPFTDSMNIFAFDDNVVVNAFHTDVRAQVSRYFDLYVHNEFADFNFRSRARKTQDFYKAGISFCPYGDRQNCGGIYQSNRMLSAIGPLSVNDTINHTLFYQLPHLGFEARFVF